jgi:catechol 2,3-dioxygenase-like lactoylglutathione lyase family enzyme
MSDTRSRTRITEVGTVMVAVSDQDRAIEFYTQKLGFELRGDTPYGDGDRWVEVAPPGASTRIALVRPQQGQSVGVPANIGLASEDVDADHAALEEQGVDVDDVMRMGDPVPPMFFMRDQDGNTLIVVEQGERG